MHIGLDFDNTIVSYDKLFHKIALEKNIIPMDFALDKLAIRDHLRNINQELTWTALQGEVYGARMQEAEIFPDLLNFITKLQAKGHQFTIVSHKTKHPYLGPRYDLHTAARQWIAQHLVNDLSPLFNEKNTFFELTKESKLARIQQINCDIFIDDLPEILLDKEFSQHIKRLLFDPKKHYSSLSFTDIEVFSSWIECERHILC